MPDRTCNVNGCPEPRSAKGYCNRHYQRSLRGAPLEVERFTPKTGPCEVTECDRPRRTPGADYCDAHYMRALRHDGDPLAGRQFGGDWSHSGGYRIRALPNHPLADGRGQVYAHRVVLFDAIGEGPHRCHWCAGVVGWRHGLEVDHLDTDRANNDLANLVPACGPCNRERGQRHRWGKPDLVPAAA